VLFKSCDQRPDSLSAIHPRNKSLRNPGMGREKVFMIFFGKPLRYSLQAFDSEVFGNQMSAVGRELLSSHFQPPTSAFE
jgi:hypothetical protein